MEEKKSVKISLSTFFLFIAIIIIVVMVIFMYKFYNEKLEANKKTEVLQSQLSNLNETVSQLQEKINKESLNSNGSKIDSNIAKEYIKIINKLEKDYSENKITCDLIYFNNDDIPDLLISNSGFWVSLYIGGNGEVYNIVDEWGYGAGGNFGYKYQEKNGAILNYNSDFAGAISTKSISILNSKNKFDKLSVTQKGITDENTDYDEVNKALKEYGGYFYNDQKISEQEYNNKLKEFFIDFDENNFKELSGDRTTADVKKQLQQLSDITEKLK